MARRGSRALGFAAMIAAAALAGALVEPVGRAEPTPDLARARELYQSAEAAMKDSRFDDAARDYGASYELSKDPALFFKIGRANERAGRCEVALIYYARYLHDGRPTEQFVATTRERMRACGGDVRTAPAGVEPRPGSGGPGSAAAPAPGSANLPGPERAPAAGSAGTEGTAGEGDAASAAATAPAPAVLVPNNKHKLAWVMTGSAIALAALGGVLAFAASSSENDVRDLYVGFAGQPPTFNDETKKKYDDILDEGRRFEHLSWASFGLAGAAAAGAAVLFVLGRSPEHAPRARVTPIIAPTGAGLAVGF